MQNKNLDELAELIQGIQSFAKNETIHSIINAAVPYYDPPNSDEEFIVMLKAYAKKLFKERKVKSND